MVGVSLDGRDGEFIEAVEEMMGRFTAEVVPRLSDWEQRLKANPQNLDLIEQEVHQEFSRGAGLVVVRRLRKEGINCIVVAPSLVPPISGLRIKTDRRDSKKLMGSPAEIRRPLSSMRSG